MSRRIFSAADPVSTHPHPFSMHRWFDLAVVDRLARGAAIVALVLFAVATPALAAEPAKIAEPVRASTPAGEFDPATWLRTTPGVSPIPFRNTLADVLPPYQRDVGANYMGQWPGAAYFAESREYALYNGGHQTFNMPGVAYASLKTLTWDLRNRSGRQKREADMPRTGLPDADGDHITSHGYNGHVAFDRKLVMFTLYRDVAGTNAVAFYDITQRDHGGDAIYKGDRNRYFTGSGGFGTAASARPVVDGIFVGDKASGAPQRFALLPGDGQGGFLDPDFTYPCPIEAWRDSVLTVDQDRRYLITTNRDHDSGKVYLNVVDIDAKRSTFKHMVRVDVTLPDGFDARPFEPGRAGMTWLRGKGIVGAHRVDPSRETIGVQIAMRGDPMAGTATAALTVPFRNLPTLENGYFGSLQPVHAFGITISPTSATTDPVQIFWPPV